MSSIYYTILKSKEIGFLTSEAKKDIEIIGKSVMTLHSHRYINNSIEINLFESGLAYCFNNWRKYDEHKVAIGKNAYKYFFALFKTGMSLAPNNEYAKYLAYSRREKFNKI